jgi:hypothetical protein
VLASAGYRKRFRAPSRRQDVFGRGNEKEEDHEGGYLTIDQSKFRASKRNEEIMRTRRLKAWRARGVSGAALVLALALVWTAGSNLSRATLSDLYSPPAGLPKERIMPH